MPLWNGPLSDKGNTPNGSGLRGQALGQAVPSLPIPFDENTYWWDPRDTSKILTDSLGYSTVGFVQEKTSDKLTLSENIKDYQPIPEAHGLNFNTASQRRLTTEQLIPITKGKAGIYVGFVFRPTVAIGGTILGITGPTGTTLSRLWIDFTSSRLLRARFGIGDSGTGTTAYTSPAQALDTPVVLELQLDMANSQPSAWLNGVSAGLAAASGWAPYADTNPASFVLGNGAAGGASLEGNLDNVILYDGAPTPQMRQAFGDYLQTRRLAN